MKKINESVERMRVLIEDAIKTHKITPSNHEEIMMIAGEDGVIDNHERALLSQLADMINDKTIRFEIEK